MGTLLINAGAWIIRRITALGLGSIASLAFLSPLGPILTGIANAIGAAITAVFEIVLSLSKSAEGRVVLALAAAAFGFLYLRFHYIEQGKADARVKMAQTQHPCPGPGPQRRKR